MTSPPDLRTLLGRPPVALDRHGIEEFVRGCVVLVTGAGGSIGAELCRQIERYSPKRLVLVDRAEDNLFRIHRDLPRAMPCIGDVVDRVRMEQIFGQHKPDIVLHAAAYKHVPMMESNAGEAVRNNIVGTRVVADTASIFGTGHFVLVSTDKAVRPSSVMGATKAIAEMYVRAMDMRNQTRFTTVRFGNVLGSTGSVVPIFVEQIANGGPVTVTHPEMMRYFMTIPEACGLVLQAASMGKGGEVFVLDMGQPLRILDLARELIKRAGLESYIDEGHAPDDHKEGHIRITFTGERPGEKLVEELSREGLKPTKHPGILVGYPSNHRLEDVMQTIGSITNAADVRERLLEAVAS